MKRSIPILAFVRFGGGDVRRFFLYRSLKRIQGLSVQTWVVGYWSLETRLLLLLSASWRRKCLTTKVREVIVFWIRHGGLFCVVKYRYRPSAHDDANGSKMTLVVIGLLYATRPPVVLRHATPSTRLTAEA
jgi:hypothetical protein